jgi:FkbM family methyltransferase
MFQKRILIYCCLLGLLLNLFRRVYKSAKQVGGCFNRRQCQEDIFIFPTACSKTQVEHNVGELSQRGGISKATRCPSEPFFIDYFITSERRRKGKFTFIEVGCNKATDAIMMLRMFTQNPRIDLKLWLERTQFMRNPSCDIGWERWHRVEEIRGPAFDYKHYCIEPVRENFEIVKRVSSELEYDEMGLSVHQVAISSSDVPSYVKFPTANGKSGIEKYGIHSLATNKKEVDFYEVKLTSVDKFVRDEGIVNVDILKIDTEGNDSLVLLGSIHTISTLRPSYITFENHGIGHWKKASLEETIDLLNGLAYTCFWSTYDGHLIRITSCWDSSYEYKEWSNVACYNRSDKEFAEIMESYAL